MRTYGVPLVIVEIVIVLLAITSGARLSNGISSMPAGIKIALAIWLAVAAASAFLSAYRALATLQLLFLLLHLITMLMLFDALRGKWRNHRPRFLAALAASVPIYAIVIQLQMLSVWDVPDFNWKNIGSGVIHVRHISFYGIVLAGLSLGYLVTAKDQGGWPIPLTGLASAFYLGALSGG